MKNSNFKIWTTIVLAMLVLCSCDKEEITVIDDLGAPQYVLPKGEPGSVDEMIYNIHEKYGTFILYSFNRVDLTRLWTSQWNKWYAPADLSGDKKYVRRMVEAIESSIFAKFEPKFIRANFPYKILLVDTLCNSHEKKSITDLLSNGYNAIAIGNVGKKQDSWKEADWNKLSVTLNNAFTSFYYSALPVKPLQFIATRWPKITFPIVADPTGEDDKTNYSCWICGHIPNIGYVRSNEDKDFADFVAFLTGTPGKEIMRRFNKFPLLKERGVILYNYMATVVNMDVVATQNVNCPEDKLPAGYFESLQ